MKRLKAIVGNPDRMNIYWLLTNWCNFSCSYCEEPSRSGSQVPFQPPLPILLGFCKRLEELASSGKMIELNISGGEPTVHEHFNRVMESLADSIYTIVTTNGSRPTAWWRNLPRLPDSVIFSIHKQTNIDRVIETARFLLEKNTCVTFNCSMDANDWERARQVHDHLLELFGYRARRKVINDLDPTGRFQVDPQRLAPEQRSFMTAPHTTYDPYPINTSETVRIRTQKLGIDTVKLVYGEADAEIMISGTARSIIPRNDLNHFNGWICSAGIETFQISENGKVWAGICKMKMIGHIMDFTAEKQPLVCGRSTCICPGDMTATKRSIDAPADWNK